MHRCQDNVTLDRGSDAEMKVANKIRVQANTGKKQGCEYVGNDLVNMLGGTLPQVRRLANRRTGDEPTEDGMNTRVLGESC